jgi:hypothetical protein
MQLDPFLDRLLDCLVETVVDRLLAVESSSSVPEMTMPHGPARGSAAMNDVSTWDRGSAQSTDSTVLQRGGK